jgi:hypothetical protein
MRDNNLVSMTSDIQIKVRALTHTLDQLIDEHVEFSDSNLF